MKIMTDESQFAGVNENTPTVTFLVKPEFKCSVTQRQIDGKISNLGGRPKSPARKHTEELLNQYPNIGNKQLQHQAY